MVAVLLYLSVCAGAAAGHPQDVKWHLEVFGGNLRGQVFLATGGVKSCEWTVPRDHLGLRVMWSDFKMDHHRWSLLMVLNATAVHPGTYSFAPLSAVVSLRTLSGAVSYTAGLPKPSTGALKLDDGLEAGSFTTSLRYLGEAHKPPLQISGDFGCS